MADKDPFVERKEKAVMADLETAFSGYVRLIRQVNLIRAWTVAVMVAALGWIVSGRAPSSQVVLFPAGAAFFGFMILELRERSSMRFNKLEVLKVQEILMCQNQSEYEKKIREYEFRDLRLSRMTRAEKLGCLFESAFSPPVVFWYGLWALIIGFAAYKL